MFPTGAGAEYPNEPFDAALYGLSPGYDEILEEGLARLASGRPTWKLWQWPPAGKEFDDAEAFRSFVQVRGDFFLQKNKQ